MVATDSSAAMPAIDAASSPDASARRMPVATTRSTLSRGGRPAALRAGIERRQSSGRIRPVKSVMIPYTLRETIRVGGTRMKILVTGATGNVGRMVVDELLALGAG